MTFALKIIGYLAFVFLIWPVGNRFCRVFIGAEDAAGAPGFKAGRFIGLLERVLIVIGLLAQAWEVMAAVVALKSVARYQELDEQRKAEYFLVGSLASILWAVLIAGLLVLYDKTCGFDVLDQLSAARGLGSAAETAG